MNGANELIPTRQSLLSRLKDWNNQEGWRVFFDTYWKLIYTAAIKAGLADAEAQDVVQETVISVLKGLPTFEHAGRAGTFKNWLLRLTSWRIGDQLRRRQPGFDQPKPPAPTSTRTATVERVADPAGLGLEAVWDEEWGKNLMEAAVERVKRKVDGKLYQLFDLYVIKDWPVSRVAQALNVSPARVYLAKHRISPLIRKEIAYLQTKLI